MNIIKRIRQILSNEKLDLADKIIEIESCLPKEKEVETEAKKSKDGKEEVTESAYAKICSDYAEKEKMSVSDAHDKLKGKYTIITK